MSSSDISYNLRAAIDREKDLVFSDSNTEYQAVWIGRLRGDFGCGGEEFWHTWFPHTEKLHTKQFENEMQKIVDGLRKDGLLKNLTSMKEYCLQYPESRIKEESYPSYAFIVETEKYQFSIRCFPYPGDYQFNIYVYSKALNKSGIEQKENFPDDGFSLK